MCCKHAHRIRLWFGRVEKNEKYFEEVGTKVENEWIFGDILKVKRGPVDNVEDDEDDGEGDQDGDVHLARLILLHRGRYLSKRVDLHLEIGLTGFNMFLGITYNR